MTVFPQGEEDVPGPELGVRVALHPDLSPFSSAAPNQAGIREGQEEGC